MAPILIDHRGLVKIACTSLLTSVFIFVSGFLLGYQRAAVVYHTGSETASLTLPDQVFSAALDIEPQKPEVIVAGEEIDVDQPQTSDVAKNNTPEINSDSVISEQTLSVKSIEKPLPEKSSVTVNKDSDTNTYSGYRVNDFTDKAGINNRKDDDVSEIGNDAQVYGHQQHNEIAAKEISSMQRRTANSKVRNKINYSIQVGTFGRFGNAENMVKTLQAQNLDAYVSEHHNKKNKTLYNVRFGYFIDKGTAVAALDEYRNSQRGDGYLVKLSANASTVADVEAIKPAEATEQSDNNSSPEAIPSGALQEKISQLEMPKTPAALTKIQTRIITN